jgi:uncharacterized protein
MPSGPRRTPSLASTGRRPVTEGRERLRSGPLVAASIRRDRHHGRCVDLLSKAIRPIVVPVLAVSEVAYLLSERGGTAAERAFARSIRDGELLVEPIEPQDWNRIDELLEQYGDPRLGVVDASIVALCERLNEPVLATLDQRHFGAVRPRHVPALTLVPD